MTVARAKSRSKKTADYDVLASADDREVWLKARSQGVGASECAAVFGESPFESAYTLYMKKRGELPPQEDNEPMKWGRRLEQVVGEAFAEESGRKVWKHPLGGVLLRSRMYPWLLATPDFEQQDPASTVPGLLEVKTTGEQGAPYWAEDAPVHYQIQMQQQLLVTARSYNSIACLIGGQRFAYKHMLRHDAFLKTLVTKTKEFWDGVQAGEPPELDTSPSTFETLRRLREDGRAVDLPKMALAWHDSMMEAREKRLALEKEEDEYERLIASTMGTASLGILPSGRGAYKFVTAKGYEVAAYTVPEKRHLKFTKRVEP